MTKIDNRPKTRTKLTIEFADNGIIVRGPNSEDDVTLALTGKSTGTIFGDQRGEDHTEEYKAIGKRLYDWLNNVAIPEVKDSWISIGAELDITVTLQGREK